MYRLIPLKQIGLKTDPAAVQDFRDLNQLNPEAFAAVEKLRVADLIQGAQSSGRCKSEPGV
ncbi:MULTISPECIES: hypothetical protein [unclassified Paenibacillus]|uniref:hypothetical protein n=1 Tax=unclassified Paenibacillus TaxID=185978 RepID=UPI002406CE17|nr:MULTISPECIES: hypothetical protein [unclassified Paenibacillus]MDF9843665.1 hypothetical protein [Paenibacillus sp. PastF-2]MDF9850253.1 hypothetical protein [Paenibacillus sp. PastM-2]MDF9856807.1 hypothetical protein [Paenibacillus sp. PastF-1]MDH6482100.1 hypothetical protein [Paenibacillus sp. PastH-2]